jgi:hypothetical protein
MMARQAQALFDLHQDRLSPTAADVFAPHFSDKNYDLYAPLRPGVVSVHLLHGIIVVPQDGFRRFVRVVELAREYGPPEGDSDCNYCQQRNRKQKEQGRHDLAPCRRAFPDSDRRTAGLLPKQAP